MLERASSLSESGWWSREIHLLTGTECMKAARTVHRDKGKVRTGERGQGKDSTERC